MKLQAYKYIDLTDNEETIGVKRSDGNVSELPAAGLSPDDEWLTGVGFNFDDWAYGDDVTIPDDAVLLWEREE